MTDEALGRCVIALSTIGEEILLDGSFATNDHAKNIETGSAYLDSNARYKGPI